MMRNAITLDEIQDYVHRNISAFHIKRQEKLENLKLLTVLKRKNPYLFRAKNLLTSESLVRSVLDAHLSSQEETLLGDFMEGLAVFICGIVYGGYKPPTSDFEGIDLIFENQQKLYVVEIKSGPNWGNSSQIKKMVANFNTAKAMLEQHFTGADIVAVNGCIYGKEKVRLRVTKDGTYWKLCGQDFWRLISGNDALYQEIIEPLGYRAKEKNDAFERTYAMIINRFTLEFSRNFCDEAGWIKWDTLAALVSKREDAAYPFQD